MPFVRIDVSAGVHADKLRAISEGVYRGLRESVGAPLDDWFHVVSRHDETNFIYSRDYLKMNRSKEFVAIQIFFYAGRTVEQKKSIYKAIAEILHVDPGLRKEDIMIMLVDTPKENWSYGNGVAQFAS